MLDRDQIFRKVYDETFSLLFRISSKVVLDVEVAEDLVHDALIKYYHRIDSFPDRDQAKYWLIRVVKNQSLNHAKRKVRERKAYEKVLYEGPRSSISAEQESIKNFEARDVLLALEKLQPEVKSLLVLKEYGDLSYKEIGLSLNITEANVKVRMFRARQKLAQALEEVHNGK